MSWASIVKTASSKVTARVLVEYGVDLNSNDSTDDNDDNDDNIPRHKEISPHPADDYMMTNGESNDDGKSNLDLESIEDFSKRVQKEYYYNYKNIDIEMLVFGYFGARKSLCKIPDEIKEIVILYLYNISPYSMEKIAGTHLIATIIDEYMNDINNKCEYIENCKDELNILKYVYIKGGACRDCILSRDIKDIDIVINIHELSMAYLSHLNKYHSEISNQDKNCKCIFWRHYKNKYDDEYESNLFDDDVFDDEDDYGLNIALYGSIKDEDVVKILKFESLITNSDYLINAKFICEIVSKSDKLLSHQKVITSKFFGYSRHILLQHAINHNGLIINNVEFDICDNFIWHSYGAVQPLEIYKKVIGDKQINNGLAQIDEYYNNDNNDKKQKISIPMYPFPSISGLIYYDFTINCMHIDLYNVLINNSLYNQYNIDFYWNNKVIYKEYNNNTFNKYNIISVNDIKNKILIPPNSNVITKCSANYFFWRLVKTAAKFIYKIKNKNNKWQIDKKYLLQTIKHYQLWFDDEFIQSRDLTTKFINKFLKWNITKPHDFIDRFHVFRYIKFEKYFIEKIEKYPIRIKNNIANNIYALPYQQREVLIKCFNDFGYPQICQTYYAY